jgi:hypothetical protein
MRLNVLYEVFEKQIDGIARAGGVPTNVVIGGSCALEFYGLKTPRTPHDLDLIIFNPQPKQIAIIDTIFEPSADYKDLPNDVARRSFEFKKGEHTLNVIMAYDEKLPEQLPVYFPKGDALHLRINRIDNIIAAKCSYAQGKNKTFIRAKDMSDLLMLKNLNFNIGNSFASEISGDMNICIIGIHEGNSDNSSKGCQTEGMDKHLRDTGKGGTL